MAAATAASTSSVSAKLHKGASASDERILKKDKSGKQTGEASSAVVDPTASIRQYSAKGWREIHDGGPLSVLEIK